MTMMSVLTVSEVQSSGNTLTFRLSENGAQTLPHLGMRERERKEKERKGDGERKKKGGGARERLQL